MKIRVGLLFGGRSGEHEVSLASAASVLRALDPAKYEVIPIGITRQGQWRVGAAATQMLQPGQPATPKLLANILRSSKPTAFSLDPSHPALSRPVAPNRASTRQAPDVIFPVLHGTFGEDGTVQGLLELAGIPYVGAGVLGSAVGMDKDVMKRLFRDARLPVVPWVLVERREVEAHPAQARRRVEQKLRYPVFVKPANLGSSVGISKVKKRAELARALKLAARYDRKILVERAVNAREIECSVLGNDRPEASVPGEIVPVNEFYDYEAKYLKEGSNLLIPAPLTAAQTRRVRELAMRAFQATDCAGMARVDFLLDRTSGKLFASEVNTIPGFTSISMYPKLWEASGLSYSQLLDRLISLALERHRERTRTLFTYREKR